LELKQTFDSTLLLQNNETALLTQHVSLMKFSLTPIIAAFIVNFWGCKGSTKTDFVFEEFKKEIEKRGLKIDSVDKTGLIFIRVKETELKVSLDNVRKDFELDKDTTQITFFAQSLDSSIIDLPATWDEVKDHVFTSFFPSDYDFTDVIHSKVTDEFTQIYVYSSKWGLAWISKKELKKWGKSDADFIRQANSNGDKLLASSEITFDTIENRRIGIFETEHETLTGALLFAPSLKEKIKKYIGFPFYAVFPVRDFCYIFSEKDFNFFSKKLGPIVVEEYTKSGYPITTEILKFSKNGVEVVGKYSAE
jgi:hypothetical protein